MSVERPEPFAATELVAPSWCRASARSAISSLGSRRAQNPFRQTASQESGALFDNRTSSVAIFFDKAIPWPDGFSSKTGYFEIAKDLAAQKPATFSGALILAKAMPLMALAAKTQGYFPPTPQEAEVAKRLAEAVVRIGSD